jgi:isopentenyl-diphosphate delta-isomerase
MTGQHLIPAWVDGSLQPLGKLEVHRRGLRHPAISVFVTDGDLLLIQRRAMGKYHTPGLWANTVCTHPMWGEDTAIAADRRLWEELGISGLPLQPRGRVEYRADVGGGLTEHEVVDIFGAEVEAARLALAPDPAEVMATRWVSRAALAREVAGMPGRFTPWLRIYLTEHAGQVFGEAVALH